MNLPKIAMGAWAWGDTDGYFGNTMAGEEFCPIFEAAMKAGLNLWDTATAYSNGESEKILGGFVNDAGRENVIVSTIRSCVPCSTEPTDAVRSKETEGSTAVSPAAWHNMYTKSKNVSVQPNPISAHSLRA